jgi:hypothetical protein
MEEGGRKGRCVGSADACDEKKNKPTNKNKTATTTVSVTSKGKTHEEKKRKHIKTNSRKRGKRTQTVPTRMYVHLCAPMRTCFYRCEGFFFLVAPLPPTSASFTAAFSAKNTNNIINIKTEALQRSAQQSRSPPVQPCLSSPLQSHQLCHEDTVTTPEIKEGKDFRRTRGPMMEERRNASPTLSLFVLER